MTMPTFFQKLFSSYGASPKIKETVTLPSQTSQSGKYLTTNGTSTSWGEVDLSSYLPLGGGTMTGDIIDKNGNTLTGADATSSAHGLMSSTDFSKLANAFEFPSATSSEAGKVLAVNSTGDGYEWVSAGGGVGRTQVATLTKTVAASATESFTLTGLTVGKQTLFQLTGQYSAQFDTGVSGLQRFTATSQSGATSTFFYSILNCSNGDMYAAFIGIPTSTSVTLKAKNLLALATSITLTAYE